MSFFSLFVVIVVAVLVIFSSLESGGAKCLRYSSVSSIAPVEYNRFHAIACVKSSGTDGNSQ